MTQIKSLEELKDLPKAVFCGENVTRKEDHWLEGDGSTNLDISERFSTAFLFDIKNWHYHKLKKEKPCCRGSINLGTGCFKCGGCIKEMERMIGDVKHFINKWKGEQ